MILNYNKTDTQVYPAWYLIGKRAVLTQDGFEMCGEVVNILGAGGSIQKVTLRSIDSKIQMTIPRDTFIRVQIVTKDNFPELYL